jgi:choline dehydrogenase
MATGTTYDYIIVGGGSAGCVLASRLTEDPDTRVLLLEAGGGDSNILYHWPAGFAKMTKGIGSWGFSTVPQKHMQDRVFWFTLAKVIGGGSTINAQIYTRGMAYDYDHWAELGCEGWSFKDVLPYFRKSEDNDTFENELHGKGGPLGVSKPSAPLPICETFFRAAAENGIPFNPDLASAVPAGVGYYQLTQRNAKRSSTARTFLKQARGRPNLTVMLNQFVQRIVVEKGRATGVEVGRNGQRDFYLAEREVILSSGTVGSPRLLQLSGIGPGDHLRSVGIPVVHDLPGVGSNLQDHLDVCVIAECTGDLTYDKYAKTHWAAWAAARYLLTGRGPVASSLFETGGFWYLEKDAPAPDMQFHLGLGSGIETGIAKLSNAGITLNSAYMRPRSRGTVRLKSSNPSDSPLIDPNYWSDPHDREMSLAALQLARDVMGAEAFKGSIAAERLPGKDCTSPKDIIDYACRMAKTDHHPAGTCAMGHGNMAVVSPQLQLHGVRGLRVVDCSIMPSLVSSNTNAPTIMIAEKAADMIRAG